MIYSIENEHMAIKVDSFGAELKSLVNKANGKEYMWEGNPKYWKRTSPVLFPLVGSLKNKSYIHEGIVYPMSQHGFARDMEFEKIDSEDTDSKNTSLWFKLIYNEKTLVVYPFKFLLEIGYIIEETRVKAIWKVTNLEDAKMYFSIGGHPAFVCPPKETVKRNQCYLHFEGADKIESTLIVKDGLVGEEIVEYKLDNGYLNIEDTLFDNDALIVQGDQCHKVSLCNENKIPYLTVAFDAPLFGVWSPVKSDAPFVCIEPWYGRCDSVDFNGELKDRQWGNVLEGKETFEKSYTIEL